MTETLNPYILENKRTFRSRVNKFCLKNDFAGKFILGLTSNRSLSRRLSLLQANILLDLLESTGLDTRLTSPQEADAHVEYFWSLISECWTQYSTKGRRDYAIDAVCVYYYHMRRMRWLGHCFPKHEKSPYIFLGLGEFAQTLKAQPVHIEDVFILRYSRSKKDRLIVVPFRNSILQLTVIDAFRRWTNVWDRTGKSLKIIFEVEDWFEGTTDSLTSQLDFDAVMFSTAKRHIVSAYPKGQWRLEAMKFLFHLYSILFRDHPKHDYFRGSYLWNKDIVLDRKVPYHLAKGYEVAFHGQLSTFEQTEGVLLVVHNADHLSANYRPTEIYTVDLSEITVPVYWRALANFILHVNKSRTCAAKRFVLWLQKRKASTGEDTLIISQKDLIEYRGFISRHTSDGAGRNKAINDATKFLRWASDENYIILQQDALKYFGYFETIYMPKPEPVSKKDIKLLRAALLTLAKKEPRYRLSLVVVDMLLLSNIRVGQICAMRLSDLHERPDGTMVLYSRVKNRGSAKVSQILDRSVSDQIRQAITFTSALRQECPSDMLCDQLFIYRNPPCASVPYATITNNRIGDDLQRASALAGIPKVTTGRLRDTYMTMAVVHSVVHNYTDLQQMALTNHVRKISTNSYAGLDIETVLDKMPAINIGSLKK